MKKFTFKEVALKYNIANRPDFIKNYRFRRLGIRVEKTGNTYHSFWAYVHRNYNVFEIFANIMFGDKLFTGFLSYREGAYESAKLKTALDLQYFKNEMDFQLDIKEVFKRENKAISPLMLYVMGRALGLEDLADKHKEAAVLQLREEPEYLNTYPDKLRVFLPAGNREELFYV
jgi:hypothetical protein